MMGGKVLKIELGYGKTFQTIEVDDRDLLGVLRAAGASAASDGEAEVSRALNDPISSPCLRDIVKAGERVAIITSDATRPTPSAKIIPPILRELEAGGVRMEDVEVVFALGSHRRQSDDERRSLVGDRVASRVRTFDSDPDDVVHLGTTSRGTPVDITRRVAEADRRICVGNVEFHYFAGYSGGAKAIMPGCSTREAIRANHSMMLEPRARAGVLEGNPVREDIEEAAGMCGVDFIVNVVLDEAHEIVFAAAGDVRDAHRAACDRLDEMYRVKIPRKAEIVVASQGGAPKDVSLYQTQKALEGAAAACADGGIVILVGECGEGMGEKTFESWLTEARAPEEVCESIRRDFVLGGHKAAAVANVVLSKDVYLVSSMKKEFVKNIFLFPFSDAQNALDIAKQKMGRDAKILVIPHAGSIMPCVG